MDTSRTVQVAAGLVATSVIIYLLIIAKHLIIPLAVAVSFWFLIVTISDYLEKFTIMGRRLPRFLTQFAGAVLIIALFVASADIILRNVEKMVVAAPRYTLILDDLIRQVATTLDLDGEHTMARFVEDIDFRPLLLDIGTGISNLAGQLVLIIVYILFLMLEQSYFELKFRAFFGSRDNYQRGLRIADRINAAIKTYITVKTFVSFLTGLLTYITLILMQLPFPEFWAFLVFLMNFIPSVGSILATILISLFALLEFQSFSGFFFTLLAIGGIQLSIGNYLDPRLMGKTLNISPLVVLFSLVLWGSIWGVIGMVLAVPIMVTLMIILSQFPKTAPLAVLLSQNGQILDLDSDLTARFPKSTEPLSKEKEPVG